MENIKRLIFPAIAALVLHGLFISLELPEHEKIEPVLSDDSINIAINTISRQAVAPHKKEEIEKSLENESQVRIVQEQVVAQKKEIRKQIQKGIEPEVADKKVKVLSDAPQERVPKPSIQQKAAERPNEIIDSKDLEQSKEKDSAASRPKKAIPIYRQNQQPLYPAIAKRRGYEGIVLLTVLVDIERKVSEVKIKSPSGHLSLDKSALKTVKKWLFLPASEGGRPLAMWIDIPIVFQLR